MSSPVAVRLQKFLADAGVASRRAGEAIILAGRVTVNGCVVKELGSKVDPGHDRVAVDGALVRSKRKLYVVLNKPPGYICSSKDPEGRRNILSLLPKEWSNLYSVGRLDYQSEWMIFLTNDGDFCLRVTHPRYAVPKRYHASVEGVVDPELPRRLVRGVEHEGEQLKANRVRVLRSGGQRSSLEIELLGGKNREVRRLLETQGLTVKRLQRFQIGQIKLGELPEGKWRILTEPEIRSFFRSPAERNPKPNSPPH